MFLHNLEEILWSRFFYENMFSSDCLHVFDFRMLLIILVPYKSKLYFSFFLPVNLLQVFFIISGIIIFLVALDIAKRERFNALHFLVFLGVGWWLLLFTFVPQTLAFIGHIFGLPRGADVLVYGGIIFLFYFVLLLLRKIDSAQEQITKLTRELALQNTHHASTKK